MRLVNGHLPVSKMEDCSSGKHLNRRFARGKGVAR